MFKTVMMQELQTAMSKEKLQILDVRETPEIAMGHIKGAYSLPLSQIKSKLKTLDKDVEYHVVCQSGARSFQASKILAKKGFQVVNVLGGMGAYKGPLSYEY